MQTRRTFALAGVLGLVLASPAYAERDHPIYEGLLPPNFQMQEGAPLTAASLAGKHIVLVASANFNALAALLQRVHGDALVSQGTIDDYSDAIDPHKMSDRMVALLASYGAQASVANDFAEAHAQGADYIAVLDLRVTSAFVGSSRSARYGLHVLDGTLRHVFSSEQTATAHYRDPGLFAGLNQTALAANGAIAAAARQAADMLAQDVTAQLGPPTAPLGDNHAG